MQIFISCSYGSSNPATSNTHTTVSPDFSTPDDYAECHEENDASVAPTISTHTRRKEKLAGNGIL